MWVINWVHSHATYMRPLAVPARAPGLAHRHVLVLDVADLANRCTTRELHIAQLARRQLQQRLRAFLGHQLRRRPGAARQLTTASRLQFDIVDHRPGWDLAQLHGVSRLDVGAFTTCDSTADAHPGGGEDVALFPVGIVQQRQSCGAIRIVFDRSDLRGHLILIAPKIDDTIPLLVTTAAVAAGHAAQRIATTGALLRGEQAALGLLFGDLGEVQDALEAAACRCRLILSRRHGYTFSKKSMRCPSESVT